MIFSVGLSIYEKIKILAYAKSQNFFYKIKFILFIM